ncbi:hypothetical protein [Microcoleus sp. D3_18a_C4]|uniref:hypothetical protein n=1 Tax=Microcoleus sp. D3_18a_C4 TaxID=3055332 RepID=UPI002FD1D50E
MNTLMCQVNGLSGNSDHPLPASAAVQVLSGDRPGCIVGSNPLLNWASSLGV